MRSGHVGVVLAIAFFTYSHWEPLYVVDISCRNYRHGVWTL